jgi:NAD(P)H-dependent FMN reductase
VPSLHVVVASVREGRVGLPIAEWFVAAARTHGGFEVRLVDLKAVNLPLFNEPHHPRLQKYEQEHTKAWSSTIASADAFVFVTPEYNYGTPPALNNALNYLYVEWNYKPAAFVSYGGISGGLRSVQMTKQTLGALKMVPIVEAVTIPFVAQHMNDGAFAPSPAHDKSVPGMLNELRRWSDALRVLRA